MMPDTGQDNKLDKDLSPEPTSLEENEAQQVGHDEDKDVHEDGGNDEPQMPEVRVKHSLTFDNESMESVQLGEESGLEQLDEQQEEDEKYEQLHGHVPEHIPEGESTPEAQSEAAEEHETVKEKKSLSPTSSLSTHAALKERKSTIDRSGETPEETFKRLIESIESGEYNNNTVVDGVFNVLVGGPFDIESRFSIESHETILGMLKVLDVAPVDLQIQILTVFVGICRKSFRNLEKCTRIGLISLFLDRIPNDDPKVADLLVDLLSILTNYSITVKETKHFLRALQAENGKWRRNSAKLLKVMLEMPKRDGCDVFFSFPGNAGAGIALPPLSKWPYQNGWTFSTWFRMDPLNSVNFEKEKPILFDFKTAKGVGYTAYFMGACLVLNVKRGTSKELTKCIKFEFTSRRWHHIVLSFVYARWGQSEIQVFIDGQLVETIHNSWYVNSSEHFDRCFVGCGPEPNPNEAFCGQLGAVYLFSQHLSPDQANCLYSLGPTYQSLFKHDAESNLPEGYKKHLFDGRLHNWLVFAYSPKNCHGQLCLYNGGRSDYFVQIPHAVMKDPVEVITTHSIHNSLHSVGGIQMLLPLFAQIDLPHEGAPKLDYELCSSMLSVISLLLETSVRAQQQLFYSQGFVIIAHVLQHAASPEHLSVMVLDSFINITKLLINSSTGIPLLKQLFEHVFFAPPLWIRASALIQVRLYEYMAVDLFTNPVNLTYVRRTPIVVQLMNAVKNYYWMVPTGKSEKLKELRFDEQGEDKLDRSSIIRIRSAILQLVNRLIFQTVPSNFQDEKEAKRDEELQCLFNFVATESEDENIYDVLTFIMRLMNDQPAVMIPAYDKKKGNCVIFKLLGSANETVRLTSLKIFGSFLCRSTAKRKSEAVNQMNLLHLLTTRLMNNSKSLSMKTYNVLFEILVECVTCDPNFAKREEYQYEKLRFENSALLKVIANLLEESEQTPELMEVKRVFVIDLIKICKDSRENRRIVLQMSVWQEWLISLAYVYPKNDLEATISELVYELFAILLYHAIRLEYGGWRVWVDTLAIAHSKVSLEKNSLKKLPKSNGTNSEAEEAQKINNKEDEGPTAIYRTPDFVWSEVHVRLLDDLLKNIEKVVEEWAQTTTPLVDHVNSNDNQVFVSNTVHVLSQLSDSLIMACGGLLPLLAAATSPNSELEIQDNTHQDISIKTAVGFLIRFVELADTFIFISGVSFSELEQEKNMPPGGILRQALRLVSTMAVRNILACRVGQKERGFSENTVKHRQKYMAILEFIDGALDNKDPAKGISNMDRLLQEVDMQRLKGVIYRDMEENRQAQFLALAVVYFLSVLMVSRYRDILEPPTSPSPFFDTNSDSSARRKSVESQSAHSSVSNQQTVDKESEDGSVKDSEDAKPTNGVEKVPDSSESSDEKENADNRNGGEISAIKFDNEQVALDDAEKYDENHLQRFTAGNVKQFDAGERRIYLTDKLQKSLESVSPLFREIMADFRSFLQKTLLGTHSQEIMNDLKVMQTLKNQNGSVIELVMLLCSQEWQTSLQKHAGLAFIELVNEGRLMAHATRDHIVRVANEADYILKRLSAEDAQKHTKFNEDSSEELEGRRKETKITDHLIQSARRRDFAIAAKSLERTRNVLVSPSGPWAEGDAAKKQTFWRLDPWEDDSRRRKRFVPNIFGSTHPEAVLDKESDAVQDAEAQLEKLSEDEREQMLKDLAKRMITTGRTNQLAAELVDESDIDKWATEELETREQRGERASFSTPAQLIASVVAVPGTVSITQSDVYFDADEEDPTFKKLDPKVGLEALRGCGYMWDSLKTRQDVRNLVKAFFVMDNMEG
ncbi:unnamed protein product [Bursaphelenchus xylophilus]|uniref:(pine wood nematode) hypothetical protein n=1 Tax=Bursaphelenchus xylophilus TaxID=6326 RepID=A0A1I7SR25_BURXY|nr:unnamed protein product [Bursaphelenchus xylophilus]CAG9110732.1 unnamed protein product [Bursaphelenchus xylophilus]